MAKLLKPKSPSAVNPLPGEGGAVDVTRKFMAENPKGSLPDAPEEVQDALPFQEDGPVEQPEQQPDVERDSLGEPVVAAPETPQGESTEQVSAVAASAEKPDAQAEKPAAQPTAAEPAAKPVEPKPEVKAAEPPKPSYDPTEKISLVDGSEPWTREQIVLGLQERATLQPKAQEADQFRTLLGQDYQSAEKVWKPIIDVLRTDPERTQALDAILQADPHLLNYVKQSIQYYHSLSPEERGVPAEAAKPAEVRDPRLDRYERTIEHLREQGLRTRAQTEWQAAYAKYPWLQQDERSRTALAKAADEMRAADIAAGKDPFEARGLLQAMELQAPFLEMAAVAYNNRAKSAPAREMPAAIEPNPNVGAEALLGSAGPGPSGTTAKAPPKFYRGDPDSAVAAFVNDYPGN